MSCKNEWFNVVIASADGIADVGKLLEELARGKPSPWSVIKGGTAAAKIGNALAKLHDCLEGNGMTAEAGAVREAMEALQREGDLLRTRVEAAGHTVPAP